MLSDHDGIPADDASTAADEPRVLVVYRSRGLSWSLVLPLLLIAAVAAVMIERGIASGREREAIVAWRTTTPPLVVEATTPPPPPPIEPARRIEATPVPSVATATPPPAAPPPDIPGPPPTLPPAAPVTTAAPAIAVAESAPPVPPADPVRRDPIGFDPVATKVEAGPSPADPGAVVSDQVPPSAPPGVQERTTEALADIQREADARAAERQRLLDAKAEASNPDPREVARRRREAVARARRAANEERQPFHDELRRLLADKGTRAGRDIHQLRESYGSECPPEILQPANADFVGPSTRLTIPAMVDRMRRWGLPETYILDHLQLNEMANVHSRGGHRSEEDAWVFAARVLLSMPPRAAKGPAQSVASPGPR